MRRRLRKPFTRNLAKSQRGAIAITAALVFIPLFLFLVLVVDTGRLFIQKRGIQTDADLAALETAILYCRDQTMDADARRAVALDVLSEARNDFRGLDGDIQVTLGVVDWVDDGNGGTVKQFTADATGHAIQVRLTYTVPASLFARISPSGSDTVTLLATAVAQACQPEAKLEIRSSLVTIDTAESALLNSLLGGLLGTTLNLTVGQWDGLLNTNLNLLAYLDAMAVNLGITAGDYDTVLATDVSLGDVFDVAADVLTSAGSNALAITALEDIVLAIPGGTVPIPLGELLKIQAGVPEAALDVSLQALQLVQGTIQLANSKSAITADIPVALLGLANATIKVQIIEPPQVSAVGNPEYAKADPYGSNAIAVRTSQARVFVRLELPIVGATLSLLESLLDIPLVSTLTTAVNSLLSLDIIGFLSDLSCILACVQEKDIVDIEVLASPNLDILIDAGEAAARVSDYSCDESTGNKSLTVPTETSAVSIMAGSMGNDAATAEANAFSDTPTVEPLPILDIGTKHVRKTCVLAICGTEYQQGTGWTNIPDDGDRTPFTGGGVGLSVDTNLLAGSADLVFANNPDASYLPEIDQVLTDNAFQSVDSSFLVNGVEDALIGIDLEFYDPADGNGLGTLTSVLGSVADTLVSTLDTVLSGVLSPLVGALVDQLLNVLGADLAEGEVGAQLTCESNKVKLEL